MTIGAEKKPLCVSGSCTEPALPFHRTCEEHRLLCDLCWIVIYRTPMLPSVSKAGACDECEKVGLVSSIGALAKG